MMVFDDNLSSGHSGLDQALKGILPGDNIVWQIDLPEDYRGFVEPYVDFASRTGKSLTYFRFADHLALVDDDAASVICRLDPARGFEAFVNDVHSVIKANGRGGYYVFDCLSGLADSWFSDQMLGNFFMLTCPYLFDVEAIAYFGLYRNYHSSYATGPILDTTQVFLDIYGHKGGTYIYPIKVQQRYSPTMYMLHSWDDDGCSLVAESAVISEVFTSTPTLQLYSASYEPGVWNRTVMQAEETLGEIKKGSADQKDVAELSRRLIAMAISRDERVANLIGQYFSLEQILGVIRRIVGTGLIGGKSVGMLLARAILEKSDPKWERLLEPHDSFYIGSDVFYTFLVRNGIWWERQRQKDTDSFLEGSARARQRVLTGSFPSYIEDQINDLLDYFGQSPFIVRSSSLLEDNFGNAFAGKYESVFCVNQGPRNKRMEDFKTAIKTIYASAMSEKALTYRSQRGLLDHDEQMALLVQRVSGAFRDRIFMPQIAGVGFSFNPYVWSDQIDPQSGVLRLVFGLGTRAVDRRDDDYTRIVALNAPEKSPEAGDEQAGQYSQKLVDVLDLDANQLVHYDFAEVLKRSGNLPIEMFAKRDTELERMALQRGTADICPWRLTFGKLLSKTNFPNDMRDMLKTIQDAYDYPVDIEFTCNFMGASDYKINLVQCRPFQIKGGGAIPDPPSSVATDDLILKSRGAIIGASRVSKLDCLVYVSAAEYGQLPIRDRYAVARLIGKLLHVPQMRQFKKIMLLGPGRWGTTSPELGVPISFAEIETVSILCEIVAMREDLVPDVSLGTHLFSDLVEMDILYMALFAGRKDNFLNTEFLDTSPNLLERFLPEAAKFSGLIRVLDGDCRGEGAALCLNANVLTQQAICYFDRA